MILALAVLILALLAEDVSLISHAESFPFLSHCYVGQSMAQPFGPSVQQHLKSISAQPYSVLGCFLEGICLSP